MPSVDVPDDSGVELSQKRGMVTTAFITRGAIGNRMRPGGLDPFALTRTNAARELGAPHRSDSSWDRWDRDDVAWHVTWGDDGKVEMLSLMWRPALPPHLR